MDLMPTLLDLAGLAAPAGLDGASLVPLMVGRSHEGPGPAVIENLALRSKFGLAPLFALRSGPYLFVKAPRSELFDVVQDPPEKDDASARLTRIASTLASELQARIPDSTTPESAALPDPKDAVDLYKRYQLALEMEGQRDFARAEAAHRSILSEQPGFASARSRLSEVLIRAGQLGASELELRQLIEKKQAQDNTYLNLALVLYRSKKTDEAVDWLKKGTAAFPSSTALRHRLGRVLLELKRYDEAERALREALALEPRFLDVYVALGATLEGQGRKDEARALYEKVREIAPESSEAKEAAVALGLAPAPAASPSPGAPPASPGPPTPGSAAPAGSPSPVATPASAPPTPATESPIPYGTPPP